VGNDPLNRSDPTGLFGDDTSMCGSDFNVGPCETVKGGGEPTARQERSFRQTVDTFFDSFKGEDDPELEEAPGSRDRKDLAEIAHIPAVRAAIVRAWVASHPYSNNTSQKMENGFWIYKNQGGQAKVVAVPSVGQDFINPGRPLSGYDFRIFFHTHPFTAGENFSMGPSNDDISFARRTRTSGIVKSHAGIFYYGY